MSFTGILILIFSILSGLAFLLLVCACALNAVRPTPRPQFLNSSAPELTDDDLDTTCEALARDYPPLQGAAADRIPALACSSAQLASPTALATSVSGNTQLSRP